MSAHENCLQYNNTPVIKACRIDETAKPEGYKSQEYIDRTLIRLAIMLDKPRVTLAECGRIYQQRPHLLPNRQWRALGIRPGPVPHR